MATQKANIVIEAQVQQARKALKALERDVQQGKVAVDQGIKQWRKYNATIRDAGKFSGKTQAKSNQLWKSVGIGTAAASIGVSALSAIFSGLTTAISMSVKQAAQFEAQMVSVGVISRSTGRDTVKVLKLIEKHSGGIATKGAIASGVLKGLTTTLTVEQLDNLTQAVKNGAMAMGEDFQSQFPLIIKGIKQLNPAILDNIGVNVRLDQINKKIKEGYYGTNTAINETTQQHAIYVEILKQTQKFQGLEAAFLETASGQWAKLGASLSDIAAVAGTVFLPAVKSTLNVANDFLDMVKEWVSPSASILKDAASFGILQKQVRESNEEVRKAGKIYDSLSVKTSLSEKEHKDLDDALATIQKRMPSVVSAWNDEGKAIAANTSLIEDRIAIQQEVNRLKEKELLEDLADQYENAADNLRELTDQRKFDLKFTKLSTKELENLSEALKEERHESFNMVGQARSTSTVTKELDVVNAILAGTYHDLSGEINISRAQLERTAQTMTDTFGSIQRGTSLYADFAEVLDTDVLDALIGVQAQLMNTSKAMNAIKGFNAIKSSIADLIPEVELSPLDKAIKDIEDRRVKIGDSVEAMAKHIAAFPSFMSMSEITSFFESIQGKLDKLDAEEVKVRLKFEAEDLKEFMKGTLDPFKELNKLGEELATTIDDITFEAGLVGLAEFKKEAAIARREVEGEIEKLQALKFKPAIPANTKKQKDVEGVMRAEFEASTNARIAQLRKILGLQLAKIDMDRTLQERKDAVKHSEDMEAIQEEYSDALQNLRETNARGNLTAEQQLLTEELEQFHAFWLAKIGEGDEFNAIWAAKQAEARTTEQELWMQHHQLIQNITNNAFSVIGGELDKFTDKLGIWGGAVNGAFERVAASIMKTLAQSAVASIAKWVIKSIMGASTVVTATGAVITANVGLAASTASVTAAQGIELVTTKALTAGYIALAAAKAAASLGATSGPSIAAATATKAALTPLLLFDDPINDAMLKRENRRIARFSAEGIAQGEFAAAQSGRAERRETALSLGDVNINISGNADNTTVEQIRRFVQDDLPQMVKDGLVPLVTTDYKTRR